MKCLTMILALAMICLLPCMAQAQFFGRRASRSSACASGACASTQTSLEACAQPASPTVGRSLADFQASVEEQGGCSAGMPAQQRQRRFLGRRRGCR